MIATKKEAAETCYLCGAAAIDTKEGKLTKDHIPAKNLFPLPRPSNLLTMPCCRGCNHHFHDDEEYFRVAVSGFYNANHTGKTIWQDRVKPRTLRKGRVRQPIYEVAASFKRIALITPTSIEDAAEFALDRSRINRVLIKLTKAFLAHLYPEVDRTVLSFETMQIDQFKLNTAAFSVIHQTLNQYSPHPLVYRCWHRVENTYSLHGLWVFMFYDAASFSVFHKSDKQIVVPWE